MSAFSGPHRDGPTVWVAGKGARRRHRDRLRFEAEERNDRTPVERTARFRRDRARVQAAVAEARAGRES